MARFSQITLRIVKPVLATAGCMLMLAGCNSNPNVESTSAPPKLAIEGDSTGSSPDTQRSAGNAAAQNGGDTSGAAQNGGVQNGGAARQPSDPQFEALIGEIQQNVKAWQTGKPYNFGPIATKICQRLQASLNEDNFQLACDAGQVFVMAGNYDAARTVYTTLDAVAKAAPPSRLEQMAQEVCYAGLKRLNLVNTAPVIEGTVLGGGKFDWNQYRGRVVLLDFWATWCPHCLEEIPAVKQLSEKYRNYGFEVVGISLDDDKQKLIDFLTEKKLPWVTLFDENPDKQGWDGAAMTHAFAIESLPTLMLIDKSGKIVSISVNVDQLPQMIEKLLTQR